ncbi:MAG: PLP-dependent aminotransferase family protein [Clostridiales bacterium]|nr:PLP-dependent aminotransferase family protein [Clostridiales bacterium]
MKISIDRNKSMPLYLQIKNQIEEGIISGIYPNGFVFPSERKLAENLKVNRNTIIKAYEKLKDDDLVDSKIGMGTYVIYEKIIRDSKDVYKEIYWDQVVGNFSFENSIDIMTKIMSDVKEKKTISLSGGFPSKEFFPDKIFHEITEELFAKKVDVFFQTPVKGDKQFRNVLQSYLYDNKSIIANQRELMVTSGAQQGISLIIQNFISPGDKILVENPSFFGALQLFKKSGAQIVTSNLKRTGLDLDHVEYQLKKNKIKFIYLLPNYQNPTGNLMDLKSRKDILYLAKKYYTPIIEEDPYGELYFDYYMPTLKSLDKDNYVIYVSTFSKTISPGFRIGYIVADDQVIKKLTLLKQFVDIHANTLSQHLIGEFIKKGFYEEHLSNMRKLYKENRDVMTGYLKEISDFSKWSIPNGGYYIWIELYKNMPMKIFLDESIKKGVDFIPGEFFFSNAFEGKNYIRLNYTYSKNKDIKKGMEILIETIKQFI